MTNIVTRKDAFNNNENINNEIKGKVIRKGYIARQILEAGGKDVWLFDIKPSREDPQKSVFIFEDTEKFQEVFAKVLESNKRTGNDNDEKIRALENQIEELKKAINKEG